MIKTTVLEITKRYWNMPALVYYPYSPQSVGRKIES